MISFPCLTFLHHRADTGSIFSCNKTGTELSNKQKELQKGGEGLDNDIVKELYLRYERELSIFLFSIVKDEGTVQDLLQETFLKALIALPGSVRNMRAWLYQVAKKLAYNHLKKQNRLVFPDNEAWQNEQMTWENGLSTLLREERDQKLYEGLLRLGSDRREVLIMQYFGGMSQKEIAAVMQLSPENVRILAYRGKKQLRQFLEGDQL